MQLYEWYLSYDEFSSLLLPELSKKDEYEIGEILVSGCGNSSLCEDLQNSGIQSIFTYSFTCLFVYSLAYIFIYLFIYSFID